MTKTILLTSQALDLAVDALKRDDLVAIPTETVYGLAANAMSASAVSKIFAAKERPFFDPLIVHVPKSWSTLETLLRKGLIQDEFQGGRLRLKQKEVTASLMRSFWPGPLTILLPKGETVPDLVTSGLSDVGVRVPSHEVCQQLLEKLQLPLAAPSANRFGRISPTNAQHVLQELEGRIPYVLDGGPCQIGVESTVIKISEGSVSILRPGNVSKSDLESVARTYDYKVEQIDSVLDGNQAAPAPGQLASHYAPRKQMYLASTAELKQILLKLSEKNIRKIAVITFSTGSLETWRIVGDSLVDQKIQFVEEALLSKSNDPATVAQNLFGEMRRLDDSSAEVIISEKPELFHGLWHAIGDRLSRASQKIKI